ncbi:DNA polymerase III subunit alpha [compost metagenome]
MKLDVLSPDVNGSGYVFTPVSTIIRDVEEEAVHSTSVLDEPRVEKGAIRFGLAAIKNVGTQAIEAILSERKQGPFESLLDFCRRVDLRVSNKRVIESLIQGGAFDSLAGHRAQLLAMLDETINSATKWRKERDDLQLHLFGFVEEPNWDVEEPNIPPLPQSQQLEFERELLGMYISGHPLDAYAELFHELDCDKLHELQELPDHSEVIVAGMILSNKTIVTKKGDPMAFMELEDRIDKVEVVLFPETWKQAAPLVQKGRLVLLRAKLQLQGEDPPKLLAEQLCALDDAAGVQRIRSRQPRITQAAHGVSGARSAAAGPKAAPAGPGRPDQRAAAKPVRESAAPPQEGSSPPAAPKEPRIYVKIAADFEQPDKLLQLKTLLKLHKGQMSAVLFYERTNRLLALSEQYLVNPSANLIRQIESIMGKDSAKVK